MAADGAGSAAPRPLTREEMLADKSEKLQELCEGLTLEEVAEVVGNTKKYQLKAAREIRDRKRADLVALSPDRRCERCAKGNWECRVLRKDDAHVLAFPAQRWPRPCQTCYHNRCSFVNPRKGEAGHDDADGATRRGTRPGSPLQTAPAAKRTRRAAARIAVAPAAVPNEKAGGSAQVRTRVAPNASSTPPENTISRSRATTSGNTTAGATATSTSSASPALSAMQLASPMPTTQIGPMPTHVRAMPTQIPAMPTQVRSMPTQVRSMPTQVRVMPTPIPAIPTPIPAMPTQVPAMPTPSRSLSRATTAYEDRAATPYSDIVEVKSEFESPRASAEPNDGAVGRTGRKRKHSDDGRGRPSTRTTIVIGVRDPDCHPRNDALYNVSPGLHDAAPGVRWGVASPFTGTTNFLRPSDVGRVPFLQRIVDIDDVLGAQLAGMGTAGGIVAGNGNGERLLPGYMYKPARPCRGCKAAGRECVLANVPAPPPNRRNAPADLTVLPLPECMGCAGTRSRCRWIIRRRGAQPISARMYVLAWPMPRPLPRDSQYFDDLSIWFNPEQAMSLHFT